MKKFIKRAKKLFMMLMRESDARQRETVTLCNKKKNIGLVSTRPPRARINCVFSRPEESRNHRKTNEGGPTSPDGGLARSNISRSLDTIARAATTEGQRTSAKDTF